MDDKKINEIIQERPTDLFTNPQNMTLWLSDDYSNDALDFLLKCYKSFFPFQDEIYHQFREVLDDLFKNTNFNTKTKKSDLYEYLEINLQKLERLTYYEPSNVINEIKKRLSNLNINDNYDLDAYRGYTPFIEVALRNVIMSKVVCKYNHLLPKKISKIFKEDYRYLFRAMYIHKGFKANQIAEKKYIQIHPNEGINDIIQNLHQCKEINQDEYENIEVKYITEKGSEINLDVDTGEGINIFDIANQVNELIGATQSQLIIYIMSLVFEQNKGDKSSNYWKVDIDVKEYCELKGINYRSDVADEIHEDIKNLQRIIIQYEYTDTKGKKDILRKSPLFANRGIIDSYEKDGKTIEKQIVGVALGKWIETLKVDQFQFINKAFFKYKLRNNKGTIIPISYYINCQHRVNLKNAKGGANEFKLKVGRLSRKLGIDEDRVKSKGYSSTLKKPLEKILNDIKDAEGFNWSYKNGTHNSRVEFEEDVIIFKNTDLDSFYNEKGYEKKETKKPKSKK